MKHDKYTTEHIVKKRNTYFDTLLSLNVSIFMKPATSLHNDISSTDTALHSDRCYKCPDECQMKKLLALLISLAF